jgi:mono/diheme cytochrome c family protein
MLPEGSTLSRRVAKCSECHTPRDRNNQLDRDRWLQGAPIWIQPVVRTANWADSAPTLAGLPNYMDAQMRRVLENGEGVSSAPIQPPMHLYHMNHEDATAIIAYLRSLPVPRPSHQ